MSRDAHHDNHNDCNLHDMQKLTVISRDPRLHQQRSVGCTDEFQDRRLNNGESHDQNSSDRTSGTSLRYCNLYLMHSDTDLHNLSESLSDEKF
uniref:Uncharacterized protein n=1 Tax=Romanomermis culicivorax TaxID=13658 RepID=A0A915HWB6_ROMCU